MSKRTYKENLETRGLSKDDGSYDIANAVERCHEAFTLLSDEHRLTIQNMWGVQFILELERYGKYTDKQSHLVIESPSTECSYCGMETCSASIDHKNGSVFL
tara:strand:+ start:546 stop:851 length:306 start_codon:yes stop_codon:yes gene_type:complete